MKKYINRAIKVHKRIQEAASCSNDSQSVSRIFGTPAFLDCSAKITFWMQQAGLQTHVDNVGNVRGKWLSKNPNAQTFVIGSHFDTVNNAGKYSGMLGILTGLDVAENLIQSKKELPFNLEIIAFSEEEGVRFHTAYLGSKAVAGVFDPHLLEYKDDENNSIAKVLESLHYNPAQISSDAIPADEWLGYLEIHTEQGPILFNKSIPVGIVQAISGQLRIEINFFGEAGHAGTVPMSMRKDALTAAALFINRVEEYASHERRNILATVGKITVSNAASNVIPAQVFCTLDLRSPNKSRLAKAYESLYVLCEEIARKRGIYFEWKLVQEAPSVSCDDNFKQLLQQAIQKSNVEPITLVSGAGHDALIISQVAPVAMLFVKCFKGISHNPLEKVEIEDIAVAIEVTDHFIDNLSKQIKKSE